MAILVFQPNLVRSPIWMPRVVHLNYAGTPEHENIQHRSTNDIVHFLKLFLKCFGEVL